MHTPTAPLLVAPAEAARMLGISRAKFYELLESGDLASVKIGRARRIAVAVLLDYVASLSEAAA